ncbi:addiction module toxin RelE [archaeon]|nr:addiction module toxin RelE [archaeon]|tara:strand:+ start:509 stop:763 length:255 start_codon:yes stop_codon:yes gene_type:complete
MYSLDIDDIAMNFLEKLPREISQRIFQKVRTAKEDPHRYFIRLKGLPYYKLRVGDYRVIADINDGRLHILVVQIGHRKNIYSKV